MSGRRVAKPQRRYSKVRLTAILVCLAAAAVFGGLYVQQTRAAAAEQVANQQLAQQVAQQRQEAALPVPETGGMLPQYAALWEQNHDLGGWLSVPDTVIDYPVMFTPEEPERYLRRAFDGSDAVSGSLFLGKDSTPEGNHAIIYGHNMKNGTMFGTLSDYADPAYAAAHPVIRFDTLEESRKYEVLAAFHGKVYTDRDGDDVFRYYRYTDLSDPETFAAYVRRVKETALYDTGVEAAYGDRLLTLSTCSGRSRDSRFVVVARCAGEP